MLCFSSLLKTKPKYSLSAENLFFALSDCGEKFTFFDGARDIWARDYMPIKTKGGKYISFRYEPSYLADGPQIRTNFKTDIAPHFALPVTYSNINLDGGNVVFSPSRSKAVITDRVFSENPEYDKNALLSGLENLLEAEIIIIPSLKSDMTGHADGVVRFVNENTVVGNAPPYKNGYEQKVKMALKKHGISCLDFPYFDSAGISAVGSYLNFLETEKHIFLPVFSDAQDETAVKRATEIFDKKIVVVNINRIAAEGGVLNCISWDLKSDLITAGLYEPEHIKIWLDDVREAPEGYCHCRSVNETIKKIIECEREFTVIDEIDCDHDLGDYASDGGDGIKLIDWLAERKTHYPVKLHTMNPVGRENMQREIDRYWNETK